MRVCVYVQLAMDMNKYEYDNLNEDTASFRQYFGVLKPK